MKSQNLSFDRLCACLTPVFLSKKRPSFARLFTKMSLSEELGTLASLTTTGVHFRNAKKQPDLVSAQQLANIFPTATVATGNHHHLHQIKIVKYFNK